MEYLFEGESIPRALLKLELEADSHGVKSISVYVNNTENTEGEEFCEIEVWDDNADQHVFAQTFWGHIESKEELEAQYC